MRKNPTRLRSRRRPAPAAAAPVHAVIIRSAEDRILAWNHGAELLYGYTTEEALGMSMRHIVPSSKHVRTRRWFEQAERGEAAAPQRVRRVAKDGTALEVMLFVTVLRGKGGRPMAVATNERRLRGPRDDDAAAAAEGGHALRAHGDAVHVLFPDRPDSRA